MLIVLFGLFSCVKKPKNPLDSDDGDGFSEFEGDCDDTNLNGYPGAAELDSTELCLVDNDEDGYGDDSVGGVFKSRGTSPLLKPMQTKKQMGVFLHTAIFSVLLMLGCQKQKPNTVAIVTTNEAKMESYLGQWEAEDGTILIGESTHFDELLGNKWLGRRPILEWTNEGPIVCDRGLPAPLSLSENGNQLHRQKNGARQNFSRPTENLKIEGIRHHEWPTSIETLSTKQTKYLVHELSKRVQSDQAVRERGGDIHLVDAENYRWLTHQMEKIGWIDSDRFGTQASEDAWLLVQHSGDLALLQAVVPLLEGVSGQEESWSMMHDRVAVKLGRPQRFGTQLRYLDTRELVVLPIVSPDVVNAERAALGLEPWSTYLGYFEAGDVLRILDCTETPSRTIRVSPPEEK